VNNANGVIVNNYPRLPNGKIDYDAWIQRISEKWNGIKVDRDLTKVF
jgi:hypothetical protein